MTRLETAEECPLVTIAIPTFNRVDYLTQAINSVISQSYKNIEIVISDNNSDDGTKELVESYCVKYANIRYYRQDKNVGGQLNWLNCIRKAKGKFCLILSDDDVMEVCAVEKMVSSFVDDVVLVIGNLCYIDSHGKLLAAHCNPSGVLDKYGFWEARLKKGYHDTPSSVMYYTDLGKKVWGKAREAGSAMDVAVDLFIVGHGKVKCIEESVVRYRVHGGNDTNNIYGCASSHVGFYQLMKNEAPDEKCRQYLAEYCENVILSYAVKAVKQVNFPLANQCIMLLKDLFGYSSFKCKRRFMEYCISHAALKLWKILQRGFQL